jgi:integrase
MTIKKGKLPERVYVDSKSISYHHRDYGVLSRCDEPDWKFWKAYEEAESQTAAVTISDLWERYIKSAQYKKTSKANQQNRKYEIAPLIGQFKLRPVDSISLADVACYLRERELEAPTMALKERKFLQQLCDFGAQLGMCEQKITKSIKIVKLAPKKRVIKDWEFDRLRANASTIGELFMVGAYLFGARMQDMRAMTKNQLQPTGVYIMQLKTEKSQIKEYNTDVEKWAFAALNHHNLIEKKLLEAGKPAPKFLLCKRDGSGYDYQGVYSMFQRAKHKTAKDLNIKMGELDFTFHTIKHTSITNFAGEKQRFSGHKSKQVLEIYDHSVESTPSNTELAEKAVVITAKNDLLKQTIMQNINTRLVH